MRIVIAGAGEVGYNIARELSESHEITVIENDEIRYVEVDRLNVEAIRGNAANIEILKKAGVDRADIFVGVTGYDEINLLAGLAAKKLGADKIIVRVSNPEYVTKPIVKNHPIGYDVLLCPQLVLASEIARLITIPGAVDFVSLSGGKVELFEIAIPENSNVAKKRISELNLPEGVIIAAIHRGEDIIVPRGGDLLLPGDRIAVVGKIDKISNLRGVLGEPVVKNVVIFGGGTVGGYVAKLLDKSSLNIKLLDSDEKRCESLCSILRRVKVIIGDATDIDVLEEEEVGKSDVVIATTDSDEKNLLASLLAKNLGAKKAIARVEKGKYVDLFEKVGVDVALSPRKVTYIEVMKQLRMMNVQTLGGIEGGVAVLEYVVNEEKEGKKIVEIDLPDNTIIAAIERGEDIIMPRGETEMKSGDRLFILTLWKNVEKVERVFGA